jgi:tRNA threonylcarbamoyladenosine biosynthesis protein TsaE
MYTIQSHSPDQTIEIGRRIGQQLQAGSVITLSGTLGAGKTWLAKGIAYGLDVPDYEYVNSPAYDLIHEYAGRLPVFHLDLYRLTTLALDDELMVQEVLSKPAVCLIEWPERLAAHPSLVPSHHLALRMELYNDADNLRIITLQTHGSDHLYQRAIEAVRGFIS